MRPVPVPVDDVCLAVTVEVCQSNPSAMLHGVLHTYRYLAMHQTIKPFFCIVFAGYV